MSEEERDETRESFAEALADWGLTPTQVAETLEATQFGLGLVEVRPPEGRSGAGIAIVVDDRRDQELRELFEWRAEATDEEYAAAWEIGDVPLVRVVLGPDAQALVRFAITIRAPVALERRFLFSVDPIAPLLARMQVAGTGIWLVASTLIQKQAAREGPAQSYDVLGHCLRAGAVAEAVASIDEALAHVGSPRQTEAAEPQPMNRAERRAAERNKR